MIGALMGAGAGLGLGGSILGAMGQAQGAGAMAHARQRQLAEQLKLRNQGLDNAQEFVNRQSPASSLAAAYSIPNAAAQAELAKMGAGVTGGGNAGQGAALNAAMQQADLQSKLNAPQVAQQAGQMRLSDLANKQDTLEDLARRKAELYEAELANAGTRGMGLRTLGSMTSLGGSGLFTAGMLANRAG